jgi:hypothetical protein
MMKKRSIMGISFFLACMMSFGSAFADTAPPIPPILGYPLPVPQSPLPAPPILPPNILPAPPTIDDPILPEDSLPNLLPNPLPDPLSNPLANPFSLPLQNPLEDALQNPLQNQLPNVLNGSAGIVAKGDISMTTDRSLVLAGIPKFNQVTIRVQYSAQGQATLRATVPDGAEVTAAGGGKVRDGMIVWSLSSSQKNSGDVSYTLTFSGQGMKTQPLSKTITYYADLLSKSNEVLSRSEASTTVIFPAAEWEERPAYIYGFPDKTFRPDSTLTRAQAISIIVRLAFPDGKYRKEQVRELFSDVKSHWASKEIAKGVKEGLIAGYPDGTFRPDRPLSRGEYVLMLARALAKQPASQLHVPYVDVTDPNLKAAVGLLQELQALQDFPGSSLQPNVSMSRKEVVAVTNKVILRFPLDNNGRASFRDVKPGDWYYGDVEAAATSQKYMRMPSMTNPLEGIGKLLGQ